MSKRTKDPDSVSAPDVGDDPVAVLEARKARLAELRRTIQQLDAAEQEVANRIGFAIASDDKSVDELRAERRRLREELEDAHVALPVLERLVALAVEGVEADRLATARAAYAVARQEEADTARAAVEAVTKAADALRTLHTAGRASYQTGQAAGIENGASYSRRTRAVANFVHTTIGEVLPAMRLPNAYHVTDLPARMAEMLPPVVETVEA